MHPSFYSPIHSTNPWTLGSNTAVHINTYKKWSLPYKRFPFNRRKKKRENMRKAPESCMSTDLQSMRTHIWQTPIFFIIWNWPIFFWLHLYASVLQLYSLYINLLTLLICSFPLVLTLLGLPVLHLPVKPHVHVCYITKSLHRYFSQ